MQSQALLKLMHLVSPALPVGAYAYSQGQEYAIDAQWVNNQAEVSDWIEGIMLYSMARLDLPCLVRLFDAWQHGDHKSVCYWNDYLHASRESAELLLEDEQLGMALARLLRSLDYEPNELELLEKPSFAAMFALVGVRSEIPLRELQYGFVWSWLENQVAAATKLVPLGQTQAQQLLVELMPSIDEALDVARELNEDDIGAGLPALAIASALHERQYSRLFRS